MNYTEVMKLIEAGFTKDEIMSLTAEPKEEPKAEPKEEPKAEPKAEPKEEPKDDLKTLIEQNKKLMDTIMEMQKENAKSARTEVKEDLTAEKAIENFFSKL